MISLSEAVEALLQPEVKGKAYVAPVNAALVVFVRDPEKQYFPDGRDRLVRRELVADFAEQSLTETYQGFDIFSGDQVAGETFTAPAGGGYFHTGRAQREHGWTDEEREAVEAKLDSLCPNNPTPGVYDKANDGYGRVMLHVPHRPEAPWPKFDEQKPSVVVRIAHETDQAQAALSYELSRPVEEQRIEVVDGLKALLDSAQAEGELTAA